MWACKYLKGFIAFLAMRDTEDAYFAYYVEIKCVGKFEDCKQLISKIVKLIKRFSFTLCHCKYLHNLKALRELLMCKL